MIDLSRRFWARIWILLAAVPLLLRAQLPKSPPPPTAWTAAPDLELANEQWDDLVISPYSLAPGATAPDVVTFGGAGSVRCYGFDGNNITEMMDGVFQMPHSWREGTEFRVHVHWSPTTADAGNVIWNLEYWAPTNKDGTFSTRTTISSDPSAAGGTAWVHKITPIGTISMADKRISCLIPFRLYRNPGATGDTYPADAVLLSFDGHLIKNTIGSDQEFVK